MTILMNVFGTVALRTLVGWLVTSLCLTAPLQKTPPFFKTVNDSMRETQTPDIPREREAILVATNQQRARKRLSVLKPNAKLMQAAQQYAELMAAKDQMSHTLNGLGLDDKARQVGYSFRQIRENIALNTRLDGRFVVVEQWMESKGHRQNLLFKDLTDIGIGIAGPSKQNRYYYCQLFGAQLN
jgi:uncharacterized protein YkwD